MSELNVNGVKLHYELHGSGEPLALVHGSWADAVWRFVVRGVAERFRVLVYDRRGHSRSERPEAQGSFDEDGEDLAALLDALELAPAHVATNSGGGNIALRLATRRPEAFRSLTCHEPALFGVLEGDAEGEEMMQEFMGLAEDVAGRIAEGDHEGAARQFAEAVVFGPGAWDGLPPKARAIFVQNATTFLDELQDRDAALNIDRDALARLELPVRFTRRTKSLPIFRSVIERLVEAIPDAARETIEGAGHMPQLTAPDPYVQVMTRAAQRAAAWAGYGRGSGKQRGGAGRTTSG
jgi:pimeloyl-ACP methyl ester carboxylesterase